MCVLLKYLPLKRCVTVTEALVVCVTRCGCSKVLLLPAPPLRTASLKLHQSFAQKLGLSRTRAARVQAFVAHAWRWLVEPCESHVRVGLKGLHWTAVCRLTGQVCRTGCMPTGSAYGPTVHFGFRIALVALSNAAYINIPCCGALCRRHFGTKAERRCGATQS